MNRYEEEAGIQKSNARTGARGIGGAPSQILVFASFLLIPMKLGSVIGRVTLSRVVPELTGARWLIVSPFTREHFQRGTQPLSGLSKDPSLVVYDALGGGVGQTIGYIEGREAAQPFEQSPPIDAINAALVDEIFYHPMK
jgi:microcompartment protein CcmK/EutM